MPYCASVPQMQMFQDPPAFHPDTQTDLPPGHCHLCLHSEAESVSPHGLRDGKKTMRGGVHVVIKINNSTQFTSFCRVF